MSRTCLAAVVVLLAVAGLTRADWPCSHCQSANADDAGLCGVCGMRRAADASGAGAGGVFSTWTASSGKWVPGATTYTQTNATGDAVSLAPSAKWGEYIYELRARKIGGAEGFRILFRVQDSTKHFCLALGGWGNTKHGVEAVGGAAPRVLTAVDGKIETGKWYTIRIAVRGQILLCYLDGKLILKAADKTFLTGGVGLGSRGTQVEYAHLRVTDAKGKLLHGVLLTAGTAGLPPRQAPAPDFNAKVEKAIQEAIEFLWTRRDAKAGSWPSTDMGTDGRAATSSDRYLVGPTALATYALLEAGVSPQDERLEQTLKWMTGQAVTKVYTLGLRANAWEAANRTTKRKYRPQLVADAKRLVQAGSFYGRYYYDAKGPQTAADRQYDNSNSQFGVLGVWAAARDGSIEISTRYWTKVREHWLAQQDESGGWAYTAGERSRDPLLPTMTTAGVATLYVCMDNLSGARYMSCRGDSKDFEPIQKGLTWLEERFDKNLDGCKYWYYYLYCMERVGLASGKKYFGTTDWYRAGTEKLLPRQKDGKWGTSVGVVDTSFALLFLVRGRHPVLVNKLQYEGDWNNRPRDLASLTRWISKMYEKPVNWQIVDVRTPVPEWHDAPILIITGSKAPTFSTADIAKLRAYVQQGGTIFSAVECAGRPFQAGIRQVYAKMFPEYKLEELPKDHPIYQAPFLLKGTPALSAISNGVRPMVIHCDTDLPASWQLRNTVTQAPNFRILANIYMHVTPMGQLRPRTTTTWPVPTEMPLLASARVARIRHDGNCDPEPLALVRLQRLMGNECLIDLGVTGPIPAMDLPKAKADVAFLTGTKAFTLSAADIAALKQFTEGGGVLVIDAAGGAKVEKDPATQTLKSIGFAASAEALMEKLYPGAPLSRPLSSHDPLLTVPDYAIERTPYRAGTRKRLGMSSRPNLRAVAVEGVLRVLYSREDLTTGLLGYAGVHVDGYTPASAYDIVRNVILHVATRSQASPRSDQPRETGKEAG